MQKWEQGCIEKKLIPTLFITAEKGIVGYPMESGNLGKGWPNNSLSLLNSISVKSDDVKKVQIA